ncbi:hypothetical protein Tco_1146079 [Tanacetum coccineum]
MKHDSSSHPPHSHCTRNPNDQGRDLREEIAFRIRKGFRNIPCMLDYNDAKVSNEDANLKFLRSLPSVWHVVATMIPGATTPPEDWMNWS